MVAWDGTQSCRGTAASQHQRLLGLPGRVGKHNGPLLGPAREHSLLGDEAVGTPGRPLVRQVHLTLVQPALLEVVVRHRGVALLPVGWGRRPEWDRYWASELPTSHDHPSQGAARPWRPTPGPKKPSPDRGGVGQLIEPKGQGSKPQVCLSQAG